MLFLSKKQQIDLYINQTINYKRIILKYLMKQIIFISFLVGIIHSAILQKVIVQDKDALCLDGSPGVYYFLKGNNPSKFILFFQGGAWCAAGNLADTIQSCYQRSKTGLGSSKNYPSTQTHNQGILSSNLKNSFRDYTKVHIKYCDGSGHQGTKSNPISYKDSTLYFRGNNLTISKLEHLQKNHGLFSNSTQIMVSGASAGAIAALTWVDYIKNRTIHKNVYGVPDSGILLDAPQFKTRKNLFIGTIANLFKLSNAQIGPPLPECVQAYPNQTYKCIIYQYMQPFIKTRIFAIQSLYDMAAIIGILGINCGITNRTLRNCNFDEISYIQEYHRNTTQLLSSLCNKSSNGVWAPSCINHVYTENELFYSQNYEVPMKSKNTIDLTLYEWVKNSPVNHCHIDQVNWPDNKPCSGVNNIQYQ